MRILHLGAKQIEHFVDQRTQFGFPMTIDCGMGEFHEPGHGPVQANDFPPQAAKNLLGCFHRAVITRSHFLFGHGNVDGHGV